MVLDVSVPEVPVTVIVLLPPAAALLADSVSTLAVLVGFVSHEAVIPLGRPETERFTASVNPNRSFIVMVALLLPPCEMVI